MFVNPLLGPLVCAGVAAGAVTVYGVGGPQQTLGVGGTASAASITSAVPPAYTAPAFNNVVLQAPPVPEPPIATQFGITLQASASNVVGLSIPQSGAFYGFSVEFSVVTQVGECHLLDLTADDF